MSSDIDGRLTTVLLSATEVLEEIALRAALERDIEDVCQNLSLFILQLRSEISRLADEA